jgi:hypothetical protein
MGPHEHGQPTTEKSYYEGGMKTSEPEPMEFKKAKKPEEMGPHEHG